MDPFIKKQEDKESIECVLLGSSSIRDLVHTGHSDIFNGQFDITIGVFFEEPVKSFELYTLASEDRTRYETEPIVLLTESAIPKTFYGCLFTNKWIYTQPWCVPLIKIIDTYTTDENKTQPNDHRHINMWQLGLRLETEDRKHLLRNTSGMTPIMDKSEYILKKLAREANKHKDILKTTLLETDEQALSYDSYDAYAEKTDLARWIANKLGWEYNWPCEYISKNLYGWYKTPADRKKAAEDNRNMILSSIDYGKCAKNYIDASREYCKAVKTVIDLSNQLDELLNESNTTDDN